MHPPQAHIPRRSGTILSEDARRLSLAAVALAGGVLKPLLTIGRYHLSKGGRGDSMQGRFDFIFPFKW
jgi:hypothetical protein